jgi:hypothetical protein
MADFIQWQTTSGQRMSLGDVAITPQAQALLLCWPKGGWVWNRPAAIVIEKNGQTRRVSIIDVTRWIQLTFWLIPVVLGLIMWLKRRGNNES